MRVNAREEEYEYVELFGKPALFTNSPIDRSTVPEGWYAYDLRGSDYDPGEPVAVEPSVAVNHAGTILIHEPVFIPKGGFRRLNGQLDFLGEHLTLADFCEVRGYFFLEDNRKYIPRPASPHEAGLFYALPPEKDTELGAIGHIRMDFGHGGKEFWHTWHTRGVEDLNSPAFKQELDEVVNELRGSVLKSLSDMEGYCRTHGGEISGGWQQNYGYIVETEHYRYCLRCNPQPGDYQVYLTCFDLRVQRMNMENAAPVIARTSYASGEVFEHRDAEAFLKEFKQELEYRSTSGFRYELLTDDPALRKAVDDELYNLFGEENPRPLKDYGLTEQGRQALRDAADPDKPHSYRWFVVENFACDGEMRHDVESLTGAIDRFNGLDCSEKRLCVTKDEVSTVYLAIAHNGETHLDESWRDNPRFATDPTIQETTERLKLSIAGLEPSEPTMTLGGM